MNDLLTLSIRRDFQLRRFSLAKKTDDEMNRCTLMNMLANDTVKCAQVSKYIRLEYCSLIAFEYLENAVSIYALVE